MNAQMLGDKLHANANEYIVVVTLEKWFNKKSDKVLSQVKDACEDAIAKTPSWTANVWTPKFRTPPLETAFEYICEIKVSLVHKISGNESRLVLQRRALKAVGELMKQAELSKRGWTVVSAIDAKGEKLDLQEAKEALSLMATETAFIQLPKHWEPYFKDEIYGLDPQLRVIWDALTTFVRSDYTVRSHICLHGLPGCGKSTAMRSLKRMIESVSPAGAVLEVTASQVTKAGIEDLLIKADPKPSLILLEEADKCAKKEENLSCFLDVCDANGAIRKTNAVIGNINLPYRALVIATVNNVPKFKRMLEGALLSRFSHRIFFPRPERKILKQIALRQIKQMDGDARWIEKALEIMDKEGEDDPRRLNALLDGKERLLDDSFVKDIQAIAAAKLAESNRIFNREKNRTRLHESVDLDDS